MTISEEQVVSIHYTLTDDSGETLDTSAGRDPLQYVHGAQNIIPGLESALEGKAVGDNFEVTLQPSEAYGEFDEELVQQVPLAAFEGVEQIEPGMQFEARSPEGATQVVIVQEVTDDGVVVNGNHPLAGQVLHFDVTVEEVRDATEEEVEHGHVHAPGGHASE